MRKQISFLLGAGFSADAGYPLAKQLSEKVEKEIIDREQYGLSENPSVDITYNMYEIFKALQPTTDFNYERFYDYIISSERLIKHIQQCHYTTNIELKKHLDQIIFNCLNSVVNADSGITNYGNFAKFIQHCGEHGDLINIHSLNHDLLLEKLLGIKGIKYADGFTEQEDNVNCIKYYIGPYGCPSKSKPAYVFTDDFKSSAVKVYKLHGSLDRHYIACESQNTYKQKETLGSNWKSVKVDELSNKVVFLQGYRYLTPESTTPDFLSGTNEKQRFYKKQPYNFLFNHFEENIKNTDMLIVIGYSFCDEGINDKIKQLPQKSIVIAACKDSNIRAKEIFPRHDIWEFEGLQEIDFSAIKSKLS